MRQQTVEALASGQKFDAAAALRQTEGNLVLPNALLTLGRETRAPQQFATEQNLRGVNGVGQPLAERFAAQNAGLIDSLNLPGAARAPGDSATGNALIDAMRTADTAARQRVSSLYDAAEAMNGADIPIDHRAFADTAMQGLDASMRGVFQPAEVKGILNDIGSGKPPLDVTVAEQLKTILGKASASAKDGNAREAIGIVRKARRRPAARKRPWCAGCFRRGSWRSQRPLRRSGGEPGDECVRGAQPDTFQRQVINGDVSSVNALMETLRGKGTTVGEASTASAQGAGAPLVLGTNGLSRSRGRRS